MNTCMILAGGTGSRTELDIPKQFIEIEGKPIICYSADAFDRCDMVDSIMVVVHPEWLSYVEYWVRKTGISKMKFLVEGGATRKRSILNGLVKAREFMVDSDIIMIHDSARPLVNPDVIINCIKTAILKNSSLPVIKVTDSIYISDDGRYLNRTMPKSLNYIGQTPACFNFGMYYRVNTAPGIGAINENSSCDSWFDSGFEVAIVEGDPETYKITSREDVEKFRKKIMGLDEVR